MEFQSQVHTQGTVRWGIKKNENKMKSPCHKVSKGNIGHVTKTIHCLNEELGSKCRLKNDEKTKVFYFKNCTDHSFKLMGTADMLNPFEFQQSTPNYQKVKRK